MFDKKISYTVGEKFFEMLGSLAIAGTAAGYVLLMALDKNSGSAVILLVVSLILYAALTLCSFFPQYTNIAYEPEKCTEKNLRHIRRGCITAKVILITLLFAATAISAS